MTLLTNNEAERMRQITDELQRWLNDWSDEKISQVPDHLLQSLLTLAIKMYAAKLEEDERFFPFSSQHPVTATELLQCVTRFMEAVDVEIFELGMWQAWTRSSVRKGS